MELKTFFFFGLHLVRLIRTRINFSRPLPLLNLHKLTSRVPQKFISAPPPPPVTLSWYRACRETTSIRFKTEETLGQVRLLWFKPSKKAPPPPFAKSWLRAWKEQNNFRDGA